MPLQQTSGAASYDAFGGGAPVAAKYIEDFFQTWLRTGTGSSVTVPTGLNGAINETMVLTKSRSAATNHKLTDNVRGATKALSSNTTGAEVTDSQGLTAFSSTGYTIGTNTDYNNNGATYVDCQWVATPKFFDVVTWTGDSTSAQTISHNLGSVPGCIIVKRIDTATNWIVYHRGMNGGTNPLDFWMKLNLTDAQSSGVATNFWANTNPTATDFTVGPSINSSSGTYVAYLFAHNAGGFGLTGTDNVISCGSFTTDGSGNATVDLGYEPQWVLYKPTANAGSWRIMDTMRSNSETSTQILYPNTSAPEASYSSPYNIPKATGIVFPPGFLFNSEPYIYIAIRRGPMRTPTTGTSVFSPVAYTGTDADTNISAGFAPDLSISQFRLGNPPLVADRLRGGVQVLNTTSTGAEVNNGTFINSFGNTGIQVSGTSGSTYSRGFWNGFSNPYIYWLMRRAPGFFDEVCYTGTGSARTVAHNLTVVPELMIVKSRSAAYFWAVYAAPLGNTQGLFLQANSAASTRAEWNNTTPTSSVFSVSTSVFVNESAATYVAYLFASCPGVSKVFSYTGNGSSQTINCGFTGGARFVMIKRTDSTGDWYVWDTARGIVANNDPHLSLNSTAAEVTTNDTIDTDSTGFVVNQVAATNVNVSSATYIGLAIA